MKTQLKNKFNYVKEIANHVPFFTETVPTETIAVGVPHFM